MFLLRLQQKLLKEPHLIRFDSISELEVRKKAGWAKLSASFCSNDENIMLDREISDWGVSPRNSILPKKLWANTNQHNDYQQFVAEHKTKNLDKKIKFCAFFHNHGTPVVRNHLYELLSAYRRVDALGNVFRNIPSKSERSSSHFIEEATKLCSPYKFVIACENSIGAHYHTEKIQMAFAVGAIPIYWGCPNITQYYNPEAFINAYDFDSLDSLVRYIIKVDKDEDLYKRYRIAPICTSEQYSRCRESDSTQKRVKSVSAGSMKPITHLPKMQANSFLREVISCLARLTSFTLLKQRLDMTRRRERCLWPLR